MKTSEVSVGMTVYTHIGRDKFITVKVVDIIREKRTTTWVVETPSGRWIERHATELYSKAS